MGWIWGLISGLLPNFWPWLVGAVGAAGLYVLGRFNGGSKVKRKQAEAGLKATVKGNAAAREGKAEASEALKAGKTPEDIVRGNDNAWR